MTRTSDIDFEAIETMTELAFRTADGIEVGLLWDERRDLLLVAVADARTGARFSLETADGKEALDAYHHPFAYAAAREQEAAVVLASP